MLERYEHVDGSFKMDRHWWIATKLAIVTVVTALLTIGLIGGQCDV